MNKSRKFVTVGVGFAFGVVAITGVIFQFFFKTKPMENIHGWLGVGMVAFGLTHIVQHWRPLMRHLRDWRVHLLLIPVLAIVGVFSLARQPQKGNPGVNPRQVMQKLTQASLADLAKVFGKDANAVIAAMTSDGLRVEGQGQTIAQLAQINQKQPELILNYIAK